MWMKDKKRIRFQKAKFLESSKELGNPGRGWYHIYPFVIQNPPEFSLEETRSCILDISREENLVLVRIDIGAFQSCEIPKEALETVSDIFHLFRVSQKQMIVRFTYDSKGRGMEKEPQSIDLIKKHMEQLGEVICKFATDILILQGIFVGSWGEMHHSKFLTVSDMSELICSLYRAVRGECYLAVRTPEQWRNITDYKRAEQGLKKRMGLFNDGIFGSSTDLGTYREGTREKELMWQKYFADSAPNGGEVIAGERPVGYRQAAEEMQSMHLSYLNSSYQQRQLDHWKNERVEEPGCWKGLSGYEDIGRHLGSRFVICRVRVSRRRVSQRYLEVVIENHGFSGFYEEAELFLIIEENTGKTVLRNIKMNDSEWKSEKRIVLWIPLSDIETEATESKVFFQMRRKRDHKVIRFANEGADDRVLLGICKYR